MFPAAHSDQLHPKPFKQIYFDMFSTGKEKNCEGERAPSTRVNDTQIISFATQ